MKTTIFICTFLTVFLFQFVRNEKTYPTKYDNLDVENILHNERALKAYISCVLDQGPCTSEGKELKKLIPHALQTECAKCTPRQKEAALKVIDFLQTEKPEEWKLLKQKFDPNNEYEAKLKETAEVQAAIEAKMRAQSNSES